MLLAIICFIGIIGAFKKYQESTNMFEDCIRILTFYVMSCVMILSIIG